MQTYVERQIENNFKMKKASPIHLSIHVLFQFSDIKWVIRIRQRRRIDNRMTKRKSTKGQTTIY